MSFGDLDLPENEYQLDSEKENNARASFGYLN